MKQLKYSTKEVLDTVADLILNGIIPFILVGTLFFLSCFI